MTSLSSVPDLTIKSKQYCNKDTSLPQSFPVIYKQNILPKNIMPGEKVKREDGKNSPSSRDKLIQAGKTR